MTSITEAGRLLLAAGLTFHYSGKRLADRPELVLAIETQAAAAARAEVAEKIERFDVMGNSADGRCGDCGSDDPASCDRAEPHTPHLAPDLKSDLLAVLALLDAAPREPERERLARQIAAAGGAVSDEAAHDLFASLDAATMPCVEDGSHSDDLTHEREFRTRTGRHAETERERLARQIAAAGGAVSDEAARDLFAAARPPEVDAEGEGR